MYLDKMFEASKEELSPLMQNYAEDVTRLVEKEVYISLPLSLSLSLSLPPCVPTSVCVSASLSLSLSLPVSILLTLSHSLPSSLFPIPHPQVLSIEKMIRKEYPEAVFIELEPKSIASHVSALTSRERLRSGTIEEDLKAMPDVSRYAGTTPSEEIASKDK